MPCIFVPNSTSRTGTRTVPREGEEIGQLLAQSLQNGVVEKQPWYEPSEKLHSPPIVPSGTRMDFDTVVVTHHAEIVKPKLVTCNGVRMKAYRALLSSG